MGKQRLGTLALLRIESNLVKKLTKKIVDEFAVSKVVI